MKKNLLFLLLLFTGLAHAEGQFYLLAKPGVLGGPSQTGQTGLAVYLRWDTLEGTIPDDVATLRLERDGQLLGEWAPNSLMSETDISDLYAAPEEQQRLLQTLTLLKEIQLAEVPPVDFEPDQFASVLRNRLLDPDNSFWTFLASRLDFNIARARHRAYLDTDVSPDTNYTYTLFAVQTDPPLTDTAAEVIIGQARVDTGRVDTDYDHQLLPVRDLQQLVENSCDSSMDHYTVVLDWLPPGTSVTDRAANHLQLAGYELYRSSENLAADITELDPKDLAADAASLVHDGRGEIVFPGLQRVNRQLLTLDGDNDPASPEFIEAQDKLGLAGLKPGDRRAYYVVGRDFTGHYGETASVIVQVPNRLSPEAPWDVTTGHRQGNRPGILVSWDAVNLQSFQAEYPRRVICNPAEAASSGMVQYAANTKGCATPATARVDVTGYRLYRFDTALEAKGFEDSDGDGVSDRDEIASSLQCDPTQQPAGAIDRRVPPLIPFEQKTTSEGIRLTFLDPGAQLVEGEYYYYRLASQTADGKFSTAVGPFRELYPDVTPPAPPTYEIVRQISEACCNLVALNAAQNEWEFTDAINLHDTLSLVDADTQTEPLAISQFGLWSSDLCTNVSSTISDFWGPGAGRSLIYPGQFPDGSGKEASNLTVYCEVDIPETMDLCKSGHWQLYETQCAAEEIVTEGDFGRGAVTLTAHSDGESCLEYYEEIAGQQTLMETSCGSDTPELLVVDFEGGLVCGSLTARDTSNNASEPVEIPCNLIQTDQTVPSPPQVISLDAFSDHLDFSWRSPLQPTSATLIEVSSDVGPEDTQLLSFPANNHEPGFVFEEQNFPIHTLVGARDQWCVRAMAVGLAAEGQRARRSDWSGKLCKIRRENGLNNPEYLPWPTIRPLDAGTPIRIERASDYVTDLQGEDPEDLPLLIHFGEFTNLFPDVGQRPCVGYEEIDPENPDRHHLLAELFRCYDSGRHLINNALKAPLLVYRQARTADGLTGPWVQVSPLIESIHWERSLDKDEFTPINTLFDPYFTMYRHEYSADQDGVPWHLGFVDRYPYILGYEYRYQTVTFTPEHAIKGWRLSDWVLATSPVTE